MKLSSVKILWVQYGGLILLISKIFHAEAFLCLLSTSINFPFCFVLRFVAIITESFDSSPKKAYFRCSGKSFSSSSGGSSMDGRNCCFLFPSCGPPNYLLITFHLPRHVAHFCFACGAILKCLPTSLALPLCH